MSPGGLITLNVNATGCLTLMVKDSDFLFLWDEERFSPPILT